jgi:small GTP-binding protein
MQDKRDFIVTRDMTEYDYLFKIIILGDSSVGKTNLLLRYTQDKFQEYVHTTIGVDFRIRTVVVDGKKVKLQLWDTAGQERYASMIKAYYNGANGAVLVYDMTDINSLYHIVDIITNILEVNPKIKLVLVGNKKDMIDNSPYVSDYSKMIAKKYDLKYFEVSAKDNQNLMIETMFHSLIQDMISVNKPITNNIIPIQNTVKLTQKQKIKHGCCVIM